MLWSVFCSEWVSGNLGLALMGMYCLIAKMDGETEARGMCMPCTS